MAEVTREDEISLGLNGVKDMRPMTRPWGGLVPKGRGGTEAKKPSDNELSWRESCRRVDSVLTMSLMSNISRECVTGSL